MSLKLNNLLNIFLTILGIINHMLFLTSKLPTIIVGKSEGKTFIVNIFKEASTLLITMFDFNKIIISIIKRMYNKLIFFLFVIFKFLFSKLYYKGDFNMNNVIEKLIIFEKDGADSKCGKLKFVKFIDEDMSHAIFYNPLVGPKYLDNYIKENKIARAYEITDEDVLSSNFDKVYTFTSNHGVYVINKGVNVSKKLVLLVDKGMEIDVDLPIYSYQIKGTSIIVKKLKEKPKNKGYCYVADEEYVNPSLRSIMIPVNEAIPGILSMDEYPFKCNIKTKKYKK